MLRVQSLTATYGGIQALRNLSLHVRPGEMVALIGGNGAGKSTLLNVISGIVPVKGGELFYRDEPMAGWAPEQIVRRGISQVPEGRQVFGPLTVEENLLLGSYVHYSKRKHEVQTDLAAVYDRFPRLRERREQYAATLSGGEQQMLAIGRALMARPQLLLLDEPSLGLAPMIVRDIFETICQLREQGTTILLVEQNARVALRVADRAYVMETGRIVLQGESDALLTNQEVVRAYLGKGYKEVWE